MKQKKALKQLQTQAEMKAVAGAGKSTKPGDYKPTPPSGPCFPVASDI